MAVRPRIQNLQASLIAEVAVLGMGDPEVLPLWFGEGDLPTPRFITEAASRALEAGETFYTFERGIPPLRQALADYETGLHARPVAPERVVITNSGMQAIMLTVQALVDPGDNILVVSPVWPNVRAAIEIMGGEPREVALARREDGGFLLDLDALDRARDGRTRAIFLNSPSNPTGWVMSRAEGEALLAFARQHGLYLIADEVYARVVYDGTVAPSLLDLAEPDDLVVVVNSFSKAWAMTGWRLGWLVGPPEIVEVMGKLIQYNISGAPTFIQHAAVTAVREGEEFARSMAERYRAGRTLVLDALRGLNRVQVAPPDGAFYAFIKVDGMTDSLAFAKEILAKTKVGLAPGAAFGLGGEGHLRLCFAASRDRLAPALERLIPILR
ncbi:MAG TPA: pyridoxal phosphate-dependent aminotransferase [Aliidongia sp.]|uniref:pyridoxal phosphate-dependent aminotransferase n=1 Tax=Aliidongia sp. TaxID=1914230 RepID=UPI002DDCECC2|nr:pyridoxal phosphate-dependent aminotransferase [Aliidongia sp.]HEV2678230.1 pyridoxal phosphate-dependent aminotransferase [Aliidongia sp.]